MSKTIILCAFLASSMLAVATDEHGFAVLSADNYDSSVEQNSRSLVFFYDQNCRNCDLMHSLLPKIVGELAESHPELKLAKISRRENLEFIAKEKQVNAVPHLRLHVNSEFYSVFSDAIDAKHIEEFLRLHLAPAPAVRLIGEADNFEKFKQEEAAIYLSSKTIDDAEKQLAENLQKSYPEIPVYIGTTDSEVDAELFPNAKSSYRCMFQRKFDDGSKSLTSSSVIPVERILTMINNYKHAKVTNLNSKNAEKLFKHKLSAIILFDSDYDTPSMRAFTAAGQSIHTQGLLLRSTLSEPNSAKLAEMLDISKKDFPTLRIIRFGVARDHKYKMEVEITEESVKEFLKDFVSKKVTEYYRSEDLPVNDYSIVRKVVALNFDDFIGQKDKDVVLLVDSDKSSSSDSELASAFETVAEKLSDKKDIAFGKLNVDNNDVPHINMHTLPMIYVYKRGALVGPRTKYSAEETPEALVQFIGSHLKRKFDVSFKAVTDEL
jgi:thioredoxin-like negative regulator of GroEL